MNMNPNLTTALQMTRYFQGGGRFLTEELRGYIEKIEALDEADLKNPDEWPWDNQVNGYIKTLRTLVGHFPLVPPVATAVILDSSSNRILLERRSDDKKWSIPGGIVGPGESVKECIVRDIEREVGLKAKPENLYLFDELSGKVHNYPNGDIIYSVKIIYVVKRCSGQLCINYENLDAKYFSLHSIPENVSGSTKQIVASLIERFDEVASW